MTRPITFDTGCTYCIDGLVPLNDDVLGQAFRACPHCQPACDCCHGTARWPAWTTDLVEFVALYNHAGFIPIVCHSCGGFLTFRPITEEDTP